MTLGECRCMCYYCYAGSKQRASKFHCHNQNNKCFKTDNFPRYAKRGVKA